MMQSGPTTLQERVHSSPPPAGWSLNKLHRVFRVRKGYKNTGMQEDNLLSLSYGRIIRKSIDAAEGLLPESFETYQIVEPGNIVMRLTDLQNDKRSLRQGLVKERGIITSAYDALELEKGHDPRFWAYALLALDLAKYYYSMGGGVRQSIKFSDFPNDWISTPDADTQKAIADFLDRETARIDQLIEKKQRLVRLLGEERRATITTLIAGGECTVRRTPRGSTWFPELPSDWALARVKHVTTKISDGPHISPEYVDEGIPFISARNIKVDRWSLDDAKYISEDLFKELSRKTKPQVDDVLYTKGGTTGVARAVDLDFDFQIWVHVALLKLRKRICSPQFLAYALNSVPCYEQSQLATRGATNNDLGLSRIANIQIPLPPLDRQEEIVFEIDRSVSRIDRLAEKINVSIERLKEFRSALITSAVTGQIDVGAAVGRRVTDVVYGGSTHESVETRTLPNADPSQVRRLVAAEIIHDHRSVAYLGRIKVHKIMFLAEAHANINEINGRYRRQAAGPYDGAMINDVEAGLRQDRYYDAAEDPNSQRGRITFTPLDNAGGHKPSLEAMLGDRVAELRRIIGLVQDFSTENTEAIATLYAVWNDALIDGEQPDDERIIRGFREEWHEAKQRFTEENLRNWLGWMRRNDLVPHGSGPHTISAHQPSLF